MEILWNSYGVPLEHHADNTGSTGYQEAFIRLSGVSAQVGALVGPLARSWGGPRGTESETP